MPHDDNSVRHPARTVEVLREADGQRLDNFLLGVLNLPRTRIYRLIRKGEVRVNKGRAQAMQRLQQGDQVRIPPLYAAPVAEPDAPPPSLLETLHAAVVVDRADLRIINKPAGWASQPGTNIRWSLVELARAAWGATWQPAHRLDRATSGCLAIVSGRPAMQAFAEQSWHKRYLALVHGDARHIDADWEDWLLRDAGGSVRVVTASEGAKQARARVQVRGVGQGVSLLQVDLLTGRMHQIRVQAASRGLPLIGDERYGEPRRDREVFAGLRPGLCLHAFSLEGAWDGQPLSAQAPVPAEWAALLERSGLVDAIP